MCGPNLAETPQLRENENKLVGIVNSISDHMSMMDKDLKTIEIKLL